MFVTLFLNSDNIPVRIVELCGPDDEGERLAHLVLGDVRPDVDVTRVPVQLKVLG